MQSTDRTTELFRTLINTVESLKTAFQTELGETSKLRAELEQLRSESQDSTSKFRTVNAELTEANRKLAEFEEQVSKLRVLYEETSAQASKEMDAAELLSVYTILFGDVFHGDTHAKILFLLHGTEREWDMADIKQTLGIEGAHLRRCLFDLRNSEILDIDEDTNKVKLARRVF